MAFRYSVNLIKEQVARTGSERALLQLLTMSLLVFAVLLLVTFGIYLGRDTRISTYNERARIFIQQVEAKGVKPEDADRLRKREKESQTMLAAIGTLLQGSVSWPRLLVSLETCCNAAGVKMRTIESKGTAQAPVMRLQGECTVDNAAEVINKFVAAVGDAKKDFAQPKLVSINKRGDFGPHIFELDIPLKVMAGPPQADKPSTPEKPKASADAAPVSDGGKS